MKTPADFLKKAKTNASTVKTLRQNKYPGYWDMNLKKSFKHPSDKIDKREHILQYRSDLEMNVALKLDSLYREYTYEQEFFGYKKAQQLTAKHRKVHNLSDTYKAYNYSIYTPDFMLKLRNNLGEFDKMYIEIKGGSIDERGRRALKESVYQNPKTLFCFLSGSDSKCTGGKMDENRIKGKHVMTHSEWCSSFKKVDNFIWFTNMTSFFKFIQENNL